MIKVLGIHDKDPNFPIGILDKIREFLDNPDVLDHPENYADLIYEMKTEAALITNNSPYAEVRAVVNNTDDVNMPCSTIRAWVCILSCQYLSVEDANPKSAGHRSPLCRRTRFHQPAFLYQTTSSQRLGKRGTIAMLSRW